MENKLFRIENNILIEYYPQDTNKFWFKKNKRILRIPDNVIEIADRAFEKCTDLKAVIIPKSVKRIGAYAFHESYLETLIIEDGVEVIGERAFLFCRFLSNIYLGSSIKILENGAFQRCANISTVLLPKETEELYDEVFEGCNFLSNVYMHRKLEYFGVQTLPPIHYIPLNGIFTLKESFAEMYATEMCKKSTIISDEDFDNVSEAIYNHCIASLDFNLTRRQIDLMLLKTNDVYLDEWKYRQSTAHYKIHLVKNDGEVFIVEGVSELIFEYLDFNNIKTIAQLHENLLYQICRSKLNEWDSLREDSSEILHSKEEIQFLNEVYKIKDLNDIAYIEMHSYYYSSYRERNMEFDWETNLYLLEEVLKYDFNERKYLIKKGTKNHMKKEQTIMKNGTDFVTNSSGGSFCVEVEFKNDSDAIANMYLAVSPETCFSDDGEMTGEYISLRPEKKKNDVCFSKKSIYSMSSIDELCDLLFSSATIEGWRNGEDEVEDIEEYEDCEDKNFVVTGRMKYYCDKEEITDLIEDMGGIVSANVSKNTDFLINNDIESDSSKNIKAKELGVPIITELEFMRMFDTDQYYEVLDEEGGETVSVASVAPKTIAKFKKDCQKQGITLENLSTLTIKNEKFGNGDSAMWVNCNNSVFADYKQQYENAAKAEKEEIIIKMFNEVKQGIELPVNDNECELPDTMLCVWIESDELLRKSLEKYLKGKLTGYWMATLSYEYNIDFVDKKLTSREVILFGDMHHD